jgi:hypothetical protein
VAGYQLTIRHGPRVVRQRFSDLDEAISGMRERAEEIREAGPLDSVKAFRDYGPEQRVAGRVELSTGGWLRGRDAGVDVMGDGNFVAFAGGIRKERLEPRGGDPFAAVREALA